MYVVLRAVQERASSTCVVGPETRKNPMSWVLGMVRRLIARRAVFCDLGEGKDVRRRSCVRGKGGEGPQSSRTITPQEHGGGE